MLLHYLEKLKIQIFCRYSAIIPDIQYNTIQYYIIEKAVRTQLNKN